MAGLGNRSFALCSFPLLKKSDKERFALSLFSKRATNSDSLFTKRAKKSDKEQIPLLLFTTRQQRANCSFALDKKSDKEQIAL